MIYADSITEYYIKNQEICLGEISNIIIIDVGFCQLSLYSEKRFEFTYNTTVF